MSILSSPSIPRSEIDDIIRGTYALAKIEKYMVCTALGVQGIADQHALYAGGAQPAGDGGASPGGERRNRRGGRFKGGKHQHHQQQNQQHQPQ